MTTTESVQVAAFMGIQILGYSLQTCLRLSCVINVGNDEQQLI